MQSYKLCKIINRSYSITFRLKDYNSVTRFFKYIVRIHYACFKHRVSKI